MMSLAVLLLPKPQLESLHRGQDYGVIQPCIRVHDSKIVKSEKHCWHLTFFEMGGGVIGGEKGRNTTLEILIHLLDRCIGIPANDLIFNYFSGGGPFAQPADIETLSLLNNLGIANENIIPSRDQFFSVREHERVAGPSLEISVRMPGGEELEIATLVFIDFSLKDDGSLEPLEFPVAELAFGLERAYCLTMKFHDLSLVGPLHEAMQPLIKYQDLTARLIVDRMRAIMMALGEGVYPKGKGRGNVVRNWIYDMYSYAQQDNITTSELLAVAELIKDQYCNYYKLPIISDVADIVEQEFSRYKCRENVI